MIKDLCIIILIIIDSLIGFSQEGKLLIVGGGSEKNGINSWSTPAYKWAGEGKRVAIIGVSTGSLAPYFKQQCGAMFAKEFAISSREAANSQSLYDTLITYQTIFFRGGDQYDYYDYYKDTKLLDAVKQIYSNGGTIAGTSAGMHILSSVVYTAKNGSAYPDECIEDPKINTSHLLKIFSILFPVSYSIPILPKGDDLVVLLDFWQTTDSVQVMI